MRPVRPLTFEFTGTPLATPARTHCSGGERCHQRCGGCSQSFPGTAARTSHGSRESKSNWQHHAGAAASMQSTRRDGGQRGQIRNSGHIASSGQWTWLPRKRKAAAFPSSDRHSMHFLNGIGTAKQLAATLEASSTDASTPTATVADGPIRPHASTWPRHTKTPSRDPWTAEYRCLRPLQLLLSASLQTTQNHAKRRVAQNTFACQSLPTAPVQPRPDPSKNLRDPHKCLSPDEQAHASRMTISRWRADG